MPNNTNGIVGRRHFIIKYDVLKKSYYIKDTGEGSGTFIKIDHPLVI